MLLPLARWGWETSWRFDHPCRSPIGGGTFVGNGSTIQIGLSSIFPIAEWESDLLEYTGATIKQENDNIKLYQTSYVNAPLETVDIPENFEAGELADQVTKQDNMSTIGALSWFASQTRPDVEAGVSLAQCRQREPNDQDVKNTVGEASSSWELRAHQIH